MSIASPYLSGHPDRILPRDAAAVLLKKRTLTNLYDERPRWLAMAHQALDAAVAAAYDWPSDLSDDEVLERLFALNQARAAAGRRRRSAAPVRPKPAIIRAQVVGSGTPPGGAPLRMPLLNTMLKSGCVAAKSGSISK